jgi:hypothetical protein
MEPRGENTGAPQELQHVAASPGNDRGMHVDPRLGEGWFPSLDGAASLLA